MAGKRFGPLAAVMSAVVVFTVGAVTPAFAASKATSQWLAAQLSPDGTLQNPLGGDLPDHGLMIDTLFAMYASGDGALAAPIVKYLDDEHHATDYYTWDGLVPGQGYDAIITGGAAAKVLVAAEIAGRDPRSFGGHDMVAETLGTIARSGVDKGRVSDYSKNPDFKDFVSNNANMFGQALAVIGLAGAGLTDRLAIDTMLKQQCSEGYFRIFFGLIATTETGDQVTPDGHRISTCDEGKALGQSSPDGDTTGIALSALLAARAAGAADLDEPITKTVRWLKAHQAASGGWGGGVGTEAPNTNSTGLIVQALADAGCADAAMDAGTAFLESAEATAADAGTRLGDQLGAIAYTPAEYASARTTGISALDAWIRASSQAALGLSRTGFHDLTLGHTGAPTPPDPGCTPPPPPPPGEKPPATSNPAAPPPVSKKAGTPAVRPGSPRGTVVVPADAPAQVSGPTPADRLGSYLASRLVDGDHVEVAQDGQTFVDYDLTADLVLALRTLGQQPDATARASRFLLSPDSIKAYAHGAPYEQGQAAYAEPLAKLDVIAHFAADPAAGRLDADLAALRTASGGFTDTGEFADTTGSLQRHAWATMATTIVAPAEAAIGTLAAHQCADGLFPPVLTEKPCATGDVAATAAAIEALNAQRRDPAAVETGNVPPPGWTAEHRRALESAAAALTARTGPDGTVAGPDGQPDPVLTAAAARGSGSAGLDASKAAQALGALVLADGGFPKTPGGPSDPGASIATASGIAGRSWLDADGSPLTTAVRLPLAPPLAAAAGPGVVPVQSAAHNSTLWLAVRLSGAALVLAFALAAGLRHLITRTPRTRG
ncbi:hypothetical protein VA596_26495 [Amycolatopsis sp., V23-08]|uniref:Terpene cyclase/mutase family protein n=1 Tax=Amycolatopsis heterodermiae TaxID=3110235 RepID=A0ABU5RAE5_9PSEU|nr:hypothetical protein [Amycolatopsis sp., V23-08]MEA5363108.1 hypothetical protein [Amycolatopsis sp., V23-08]